MIPPGKTLGILGGGQLGRMLAQAAQTLGYRVHVFEPAGPCPAGALANKEVNAAYDDIPALTAFARACDVVTYEFENIPSAPLAAIAGLAPLHPRAEVLHICQNRQREKTWLRANNFPHVRYAEALDGDIAPAIALVGRPCVVKTADFGYDGKGQMKIVTDADLEQAAAIFRGRRCVVERWIDFSSVPARVSPPVIHEAETLALAIAEKLGVVGLLAVEMFVTTGGDVLVNELAPRPHNSGHWSLDGCETNQFEQHVRAVCGLPLGGVGVREPTVMVNILGDAWFEGTARREPNWATVLGAARAKLHLYGKADPRPGRKMGHFTVRDADINAALTRAQALKQKL